MYPKLVRTKGYTYLRLIERVWVNGIWGDRVVANLGRQDVEGRQVLGELLKKLRRFTDEVLVTPEEIESRQAKEYGPALVCQRLWQEIGLDGWLKECCGEPLPVSLGEPGVLAMVSNRLAAPRSKLALYDWLPTVHLPDWPPKQGNGKDQKEIKLPDDPVAFANWFYNTMDWLVKGKSKDKIEERIASWARTLFPVTIAFFDITNIQFEGWEKLKQARYGYIRLGRKNHKQILLGLVMIEGIPVASYLFRGNRAEKTTLLWVKEKIKKNFNVERIVFVCDRGLISEENLTEIEASQDGYIVALKRRRCEEVEPLLLEDISSFVPIQTDKKDKVRLLAWEAPPEDGKRRIVAFNPIKAEEEKKKRLSIIQELGSELQDLKEKIESGKPRAPRGIQAITTAAEKILSRKQGKRYFIYQAKEGGLEFGPNEKGRALEEKLDGKFVIKTTENNLALKEVVFKYKDLMDIEDGFRNLKDFIRTAPVFHWRYRRVKAHVFICVLALLLERYLQQKLDKAGLDLSARKALEKLKNIKVVENQVGHLNLKYVTPPTQELSNILAACGIFKLPKILADGYSKENYPPQRKPALNWLKWRKKRRK